MGQAKIKQRMAFPPQLVSDWEDDDCVNFAIALARITGWLLHVDWLTYSTQPRDNESEHDMIPLRVYVADNGNNIFDVRGLKNIENFSTGTIKPLVMEKQPQTPCGVSTRFYSEEKLFDLPLRVKPNEKKIELASEAIKANTHYLKAIQKRNDPCIPAASAAKFSLGRCQAYAEALAEFRGLQAAALLANKYSPMFSLTERSRSGYFHSIVLHPDGDGEDSWGKASIQEIAKRFGVVGYTINENEHVLVLKNLLTNTPDLYEEAYKEAKNLIKAYLSPSVI